MQNKVFILKYHNIIQIIYTYKYQFNQIINSIIFFQIYNKLMNYFV